MFVQKGKTYAKAIELKEWLDPVEDVAAVFSEKSCTIYFFVRGNEKIGKLSFEGAWSYRSVRTEIARYMDKDSNFGSSILEVFNSPWPGEVEFGFYTEFSKARLRDTARHFLIKGHDIYHEVLCLRYTETYLAKDDVEYEYATQTLNYKA